MAQIQWRIHLVFCNLRDRIRWQWVLLGTVVRSLCCNVFIDQNYIADTFMEPIFWVVDNFTKFLGPFFVVSVCGMTASVVWIAHWIGIPYWWSRSPATLAVMIVIGYWLLLNITFHYYMAATTSAGSPPEGALIPEVVSICKKCIAPKPPRTHHCSVCNQCILKMDHHCPWLNNCIGHYNHRYFFMYMAYMTAGVFFLMVFGFEVMMDELWWEEDEEEELVGLPIRKYNDTYYISMTEDGADVDVADVPPTIPHRGNWYRAAIIYEAVVSSGVFIALGALAAWHARLIGRGETSIEAHINKTERKRVAKEGKIYLNPYDFGGRENWTLFLGLVEGRSWRHLLFPSTHAPQGNGLTWRTINCQWKREGEDLKTVKVP